MDFENVKEKKNGKKNCVIGDGTPIYATSSSVCLTYPLSSKFHWKQKQTVWPFLYFRLQ